MNLINKTLCCLGSMLIAAILFVNQSHAADKIGVVDLRKAILTSTAGQKAKDLIDQKAKTFQADLKKDQEALIALQKEM